MTRALLILGHGSRAHGASDDMARLVAGLAARLPAVRVALCHMELAEPSLEQAIDDAVAAGCMDIAIVPYFLHLGRHLREDIPERLRAAAARHPGLVLRFGRHLGYDERLLALLAERAQEALSAPPLSGATPSSPPRGAEGAGKE